MISGITSPWGQLKKDGAESKTDTSTGGTTSSSDSTTNTESSGQAPPVSVAADQPAPISPSLRDLLAQNASLTATPLTELAQALGAANAQAREQADALPTDAAPRTRAEIMANASLAMIAQATQTQQGVMAVLKQQL